MKRTNPYKIVEMFEQALCDYSGAKYAVATTSCTASLILSMQYFGVKSVEVPKYTYVSVPMAVKMAGGKVKFTDEEWVGTYQLKPYPIWDCARWFTSDMYKKGQFMCLSFHRKKVLDIGQGGAILLDDKKAYEWLKKARFNGRTAGVDPKVDEFPFIGYPFNMMPRDAAEGLTRLFFMPDYNPPLPNDDYPDLSKINLFNANKR